MIFFSRIVFILPKYYVKVNLLSIFNIAAVKA